MADWLYDGPSVALSAWPTCVCVRPSDSRRILNCLANSRISSRLTPSTIVPSRAPLIMSTHDNQNNADPHESPNPPSPLTFRPQGRRICPGHIYTDFDVDSPSHFPFGAITVIPTDKPNARVKSQLHRRHHRLRIYI